MGLRINTNVASLNAQSNLFNVTNKLSGNYSRLSSGLRTPRGWRRRGPRHLRAHALADPPTASPRNARTTTWPRPPKAPWVR